MTATKKETIRYRQWDDKYHTTKSTLITGIVEQITIDKMLAISFHIYFWVNYHKTPDRQWANISATGIFYHMTVYEC